MGKLSLVNVLQVVKRTNAPLTPQQMASSAGPWVFWVVGLNPTIHNNKLFQTLPMSNLKKNSPVSPGNETAWMLTDLPVYPADLISRRFRGEECCKA